jgi:hypothetical protein
MCAGRAGTAFPLHSEPTVQDAARRQGHAESGHVHVHGRVVAWLYSIMLWSFVTYCDCTVHTHLITVVDFPEVINRFFEGCPSRRSEIKAGLKHLNFISKMKYAQIIALFALLGFVQCNCNVQRVKLHRKPVNLQARGTRPYLHGLSGQAKSSLKEGDSVPLSNFLDAQVRVRARVRRDFSP